ncbi:MAG: threonylcarbamoyl-AMP synthase [Nitrospiraceae bacterium]|nr:MAG: threonylcarbamoyl-AMP synthase [Nitrospiraceae bacterium]
MRVLPLTENSATRIFSEAREIIRRGGIVAYPTESSYALGVLATDERSVRKLFELKKRPGGKPVPLIAGDRMILLSVVQSIPQQAEYYMDRYWPGPLTLVFNARDGIPPLLTGGTGKVAVRIPGAGPALDLARCLQLPATATSANLSSLPPAEDAEAVAGYFQDEIDLIIDGGRTPGGRPSTILDVTVDPPRVLREGRVVLRD